MDLRTKLVFVLVAVALASMLALGTLAYTNAEDLIAQRSARSLASLAEAKAERVESVVRGWEEAVGLLASRTQLRRSLADWNRSASEDHRTSIARILADAHASSDLVEGVAVYDPGGKLVASTVPADSASALRAAQDEGALPHADAADPTAADRDAAYPASLLGFTRDVPPRVSYVTALTLDGMRIGTLRAFLSTADLAAVAANRTGLRETGEVLIAARDGDGEIRLLTPLRHPAEQPDSGAAAAARLMRGALGGGAGPITRGLVDHRGEAVWASARWIDAADLGLLVKFDETEERADMVELRDRVVGVGFSLAAFAVLAGVGLAFAFARPINQLAGVARRIHDGDLSARADADREDELGLLAETFNQMSDELERRMTVLQEFKTFFDQSRDMLCIAGTDGYFKRVNPAFERVLGWTEQELLGRPFVDFVHPDDADATIRETESLADGHPTISFSNRYRCKDGTYKRLRWTSHPDPATGNIYASARGPADPES